MRRLTTGIYSEKCVVRRFRRFADVIQCTYTNLDSTVQPITHLDYMVWPIAPRLQTITASYCNEYCRKLYHSGTIILYDGTTVVICGPLLTEASLCGA
jgi:hypothetical protein